MKTISIIISALFLFGFGKAQSTTNTTVSMEKVQFNSAGLSLAGNLFLPEGFDSTKQYPAIIVDGSWTTVKEQMQGLYAKKLS
jgi:fermentation-respiration switch protein FrsA (DUF1100 family)